MRALVSGMLVGPPVHMLNMGEICLLIVGAMLIGAYFYNHATPVPEEIELATAQGGPTRATLMGGK
jgi:hypothetical protein